MYRCKRNRQSGQRSCDHYQNCSKISRKKKLYRLFDIFINIPATLHSLNDRGKIVIRQDHGCCILCNFRSCNSHGNTNISLFKCRCIVDTISGHCHNISPFLPCTDNPDLVLRCHTRVNPDIFHKTIKFFITEFIDLRTLAGL